MRGYKPSYKVDTEGREHLSTLAPGTVKPTGWVAKLAEIESNAWIEMIVRKDEFNFRTSFYDGSPTPHGGEWAGYWNDAFIGLSILTRNDKKLEEVKARVEAILVEAQKRDKVLSEYYNGWGSHLMLGALLTYFEYSQDQRILDFCHRVALELMENLYSPDGHAFDGDHQVNMVSSCARIYGYTGDNRMLEMAEEIAVRFDFAGLPNIKRLLNDDHLHGHCVNYCEDLRYPADMFIFSGNPDHLRASLRGVELTEKDHLQVQGVPTGNEVVYGKGPFKETEHCDTVEWSLVGHSLLAATGDVRFADMAEKVIFNAWAGSRKWDGCSLSYNHMPNQLTASAWEGSWVPRLNLSHRHEPLCCNLNSHRAVFPYANRMWMLKDGGLAVVYYGDCRLEVELPDAGVVEFVEETGYPFEEEVMIAVSPERPARFPLSLRIPGWCRRPQVFVNGEPTAVPESGSFYVIDREWHKGDKIKLAIPMPIELEWAETFDDPVVVDPNHANHDPSRKSEVGLRNIDSPASGKHLVAIKRGPLVYSLYIEPDYIQEPAADDPEGYIVENIVPRKGDAPWNVALILDQDSPESSFEFLNLEIPVDSGPFRYPPVALRCKGCIVPGWTAGGTTEKPMTTLPGLPVKTYGNEIDITLVPFGCTNIRLTWLPFVFAKYK